MVKIAVAGGTGNVATEILRTPIATGKHTITIFTRRIPPTPLPGISYKLIDYTSLPALTTALQGYDVCLSFLVVSQDTHNTAQKNLIRACITAGVRRFSPSEWGIKNGSGAPPYANKDAIADYLAELNKGYSEKKKLEYCLWQPSIFMDYFAHPYALSPGLVTWPFFIDFESRRAIVLDGGDQPMVVTRIADISDVLALALESEEEWPVVGGMRGARTTINELLDLGRKIRGGEWTVEYVSGADIEKGVLKTEWVPRMAHPVIPEAKRESFSTAFVIMFLRGLMKGSWDVSDEWNKRVPEYKFTGLEEYLTEAWKGKP